MFEIKDVDKPTPLATEVVVAVRAIGTNPVETYIRAGAIPLVKPPAILGWDISGVVDVVAPGVNRFAVGDEVFGMPLFPRAAGAYAEYVAAPSRQLVKKPAGLDHVHAAALPLAGLTAWQALVDTARVQPGQRVLIHGGGGGVGHLAVQIARALGAHVVATASAGKRDFVRGLGADEVIDYRAEDFARTVKDIDVVLELIGGDYGARSIDVLRPGGLLVTAVERSNAALAAKVTAAGRRFAGLTVEPDHVGLERLAALVVEGKLRVHVSHALPLDEVARAHALYASGGITGKIVLTV
ncbi:MAG TPA: NADP-dependent oxidoreductase [Kofleriaceae bacterium]|nr:NADP-dependent oxidoreductase [Kofleriaceae bacterium]